MLFQILFLACGGATYDQGYKPVLEDTSVEDTGTNAPTAEPTQEPTQPAAEPTQEPAEEPEEQIICNNMWHPVHVEGAWEKNYSLTINGKQGTAVQKSGGIETFNNIVGYAYEDSVTYSEDPLGLGMATPVSYSGKSYVTCDYNGDEGMFLLGWAGVESKFEFDITTFQNVQKDTNYTGTLNPPIKYLSPAFIMDGQGTEGGWNYSSSLTTTSSTQLDGSFSDFAAISWEWNGQTYQAHQAVHAFTIQDTSNPFQTTQKEIYIEQIWVKGMGMVEEIIKENEQIYLQKTLISATGLTPENP